MSGADPLFLALAMTATEVDFGLQIAARARNLASFRMQE